LSGSGRLSYGDKRRQLTEIRSADLRFSPAYAGRLVASVAQVKIGALALDPMEPSDPKAPLVEGRVLAPLKAEPVASRR
jgi:hypothetical protein